MSDAAQRLAYQALGTMLHQFRCPDCGREPTVTLDENHKPIMACRYHPAATLEER